MIDLVNELCRELVGHPALTDVVCAPGQALGPAKFDDLEEEYSVSISPDARQVFSVINGFDVAWRFHHPTLAATDSYIEGRAKILTFHQMFMGFDGRFWRDEIWHEGDPKSTLDFMKRLKVLDYYGAESLQCVCVEVTKTGVLSPDLWLFHAGDKPLRLTVGLSEYLGKLRRFRAIWGWQWLFTEAKLANRRYEGIRKTCEEMIEWYPKIFDDGTASELKARYETLRAK